jgi:CBS domain-containing protein
MQVGSILDLKGRSVATVERATSLLDAAAVLRDRGVGALVVSPDGARIEGIVSERDIVRAVAAHGASGLGRDVASAMSSEVTTCTETDSVDHLMALMTEHRIRHVPVVDGEGALCGIVSIGDVVKVRVGELESENRTLFDYIHAR